MDTTMPPTSPNLLPASTLSGTTTEFRLLPLELISDILIHLEAQDWVHLQLVHSSLRVVVQRSLKFLYGPQPYHRVDATSPTSGELNFTMLAHEQARWEPIYRAPEEWLGKLHEDWYHSGNDNLSEAACEVLLDLRKTYLRPASYKEVLGTRAWKEAVSAALMIQGRYDEAKGFYKSMVEGRHELPRQTVLTAARWGWPFEDLSWAPASIELLNRASLGAALAGDLTRLRWLFEKGVQKNVFYGNHCLATAAATNGQVHVLKFLLEHGVNLNSYPSQIHSPLWATATHGHVTAARFLLDRGANPNLPEDESPYHRAATLGRLDILKLFATYTTIPWRLYTDHGSLREVIRQGHSEVIKYLVQDAGVSINELDEKGQSMLHHAVKHDKKEVALSVIELGIDTNIHNITGQTAFEFAASCDKGHWFSRNLGFETGNLKEEKLSLARGILSTEKPFRFEEFVNQGVSSKEIENYWLICDMDERVSNLWVQFMSKAALRWFSRKVLGSSYFKDIYLRAIRAIGDRNNLPNTHNQISGDSIILATEVGRRFVPYCLDSERQQYAYRLLAFISYDKLQELNKLFTQPDGRLYTEALRAKHIDEIRLVTDFLKEVRQIRAGMVILNE